MVKGGKPLRGHDESADSNEKGLFLEVVDLLKRYDVEFKEYLDNAPKNCTYLSNRIQNDILTALRNVILQLIREELEGQSVALTADETSDVGRHEQLSVVLRYIPKNEVLPVERFISMNRLTATDAQTIFNSLTTTLQSLGVAWENVLAVAFDGASNMSGEFSGVQAKSKLENKSILYTHCWGHCLNLVLVDACSPHRHAVFEKIVAQTNSKLKSLKSLSETRWACRAEAVAVVRTHFKSIIETLENIIQITTDSKAKAKGVGILKAMKHFNFIICMEIIHPILQLIVLVSRTLQSPTIDLTQAMKDVSALALSLNEMRISDTIYDDMYARSVTICDELSIDIPTLNPKSRKVSTRIDRNPSSAFVAASAKDDIKFFVFNRAIDDLIESLNDRFDQETKKLITAVGKILSLGSNDYTIQPEDITLLSNQFKLDSDSFEAEIRLFKTRRNNALNLQNTLDWLEWLSKHERQVTYENVYKLLAQFATIPVTSCTCERSFSKLKIVKTKLRSTMLQDRLDNLLLPFIEQELAAKAEEEKIIEEFKKIVSFDRRMAL
uniref:HAT C-terminal dimerisation domain-containing protein n=1 Tax=Trichogramma kaykai TaxID=54128 RepID=A0ABD2XBT5_9HYME